MQAFHDRFGASGLDTLWDEISGWVSSPTRFFRNYTVRYLGWFCSCDVTALARQW
jgi:RNAse (barnase) inhibitor barstar